MSEITASMVKTLRERTGAGIMDCKKALAECSGDMEAAIDYLRKSGQAKAVKREGKVTAEGVVAVAQHASQKQAYLLEINCETDFVARDHQFKAFTEQLIQACSEHSFATIEELLAHKTEAGSSLEEVRCELVAKIGENIQVRRMQHISSEHPLGVYQHGDRIAACVSLNINDPALGKDLAMHITASNPAAISEAELDAALIAKERDIFVTQALQSGKPEAIIDKIVAGQIAKFVNAQTLVGQPFIKDPDQTVANLLKSHAATVTAFIRLEVGEGIEKEEQDFAAEVQAQIKGSD